MSFLAFQVQTTLSVQTRIGLTTPNLSHWPCSANQRAGWRQDFSRPSSVHPLSRGSWASSCPAPSSPSAALWLLLLFQDQSASARRASWRTRATDRASGLASVRAADYTMRATLASGVFRAERALTDQLQWKARVQYRPYAHRWEGLFTVHSHVTSVRVSAD